MAEESKISSIVEQELEEKESFFTFQTIYTAVVLNWQWFVLSIIICLGTAHLYLRYKSPTYSATAKILVKQDQSSKSSRGAFASLQNMSEVGSISNSYGIDNEMEILTSTTIAESAVRDLKLYADYWMKGTVKGHMLYRSQPISADVDREHLDKLNFPIRLEITYEDGKFHAVGNYRIPIDEISASSELYEIDKTFDKLPYVIKTGAGTITLTKNMDPLREKFKDGMTERITIISPQYAAIRYVNKLSVAPTSKMSDVIGITFQDQNVKRSLDYLNQLILCYNRQANDDKNLVAYKTEQFINERLEKINAELGSTDGALEAYKRNNNLVELKIDAKSTVDQVAEFERRLTEANTQIALINSLIQFANRPGNKHEVLPSNVGLNDMTSTTLINQYNVIALERNRMLITASENSPSVLPLTSQLDEMSKSIQEALGQARRNIEIQRSAIVSQLNQYTSAINKTPEQERILTQIGRQQEVKSGLYLMMLQKREENSISLAATADKGKVVEYPQFAGKVSPRSMIIYLIGLVLGLTLPVLALFLINFFRYRIEGHDEVAKLTKLPILADVAVASDTAKTKADIVVHENENNQMEEIFRSMRTNLQFMMKENEKVVLFTSTTSGEGKTFTTANLAVSFALLGKKVVLVGLDIRKPRLAELFEINNHHNGITPLLTEANPTWEQTQEQIVPSGINKNLDLLMAGPIPPNPAELIARDSLDIVVSHLREHYDYVLIDTAPVGLVTDTLQAGRVGDATVYLCRADYTPKRSFELINSLAEEKKLPNMAVVINGIDMSKKKYGYYYGYGRYGKYGRYTGYGSSSYSGHYSHYGNYKNSHYGNAKDTSIKL
ncbi:MAG: polysaccharide biosynthesis tyrosine autokinase [Prevotella sp.]|nr:polysaccharide biosynthesis tyrosine autokinase [Prevotella sp.]MBQ8701183.1 polysaccharide biosynthesis tyrosine autokinase [Prevotella sp.]MBQ8702709.1 polysaccharide biosynthesis tyrosine autokinase [Prevotella sp.]MBQ9651533.1 polysaccharide biosynthesis tyrosine autokinase [Prevotella sp.]